MRRALVPCAILGLMSLGSAFLAVPGGADGLACVRSPLRWVQNDVGSGQDAGDAPEGAVALAHEGWSFGALTIPVNDTVEDISDWFVLDVPPGPRTVTFDGQNVANLLLGMGNTVPLILYYEIWREGEASPALEFASWAQPAAFGSPGDERLRVHVYPSPLLLFDGCTQVVPVPVALGLLPDPAQTYGFLADCAPDCLTS
jgi:hypothetical protein